MRFSTVPPLFVAGATPPRCAPDGALGAISGRTVRELFRVPPDGAG
ncbi:MAG: hypothetical protein IH611_12805, partial [Deltaproteobacteria bacterium]|nr:hypothetical protein [Deltaproteobacteria bacterium]